MVAKSDYWNLIKQITIAANEADSIEQVMKASLDEITRTWNVREWDGIPICTHLLVPRHGLAQAHERFAQGACSDSLQHDQPMKLDF